MRRLSLIFLAAVMLVAFGCVGLETTETQDYMIKKTARLAAIYLALERPDDVQEALSYCGYLSSLEDGKLKEAALKTAIEYIKKEYGSSVKAVILISEVTDLIQYAVPDDAGLTINPKMLNMAVEAFKSGLEIAAK